MHAIVAKKRQGTSSTRTFFVGGVAALGLCIALVGGHRAKADNARAIPEIPAESKPIPTVSLSELVTSVVAELDKAELPVRAKQAILDVWRNTPPESRDDFLRKSVQTAALWNPRLKTLVHDGAVSVKAVEPSDEAQREVDRLPTAVRDAVRVVLAGYCVGYRRYEWALEWLNSVQPEDVADPAACLLYRGAAHFGLIHKSEALADLGRVLQLPEDVVPIRYRVTAERMRADLADMSPESLKHIARRMDDVERRLDHGEHDDQLPKIENGIVESLDKLIEKLEQQRQQQQQQAAAAQSQNQSATRPASESRLMKASGQGRVTKRNIGHEAGWGDLPPKEREKALREIAREFPPHYRKVIEEYFRRLASESDQ